MTNAAPSSPSTPNSTLAIALDATTEAARPMAKPITVYGHPLSEDHHDELARCGSQHRPHADFPPTLIDAERENAVKAGGGQRQREHRERPDDERRETWALDGSDDLVGQRSHLSEGGDGIELLDDTGQQRRRRCRLAVRLDDERGMAKAESHSIWHVDLRLRRLVRAPQQDILDHPDQLDDRIVSAKHAREHPRESSPDR